MHTSSFIVHHSLSRLSSCWGVMSTDISRNSRNNARNSRRATVRCTTQLRPIAGYTSIRAHTHPYKPADNWRCATATASPKPAYSELVMGPSSICQLLNDNQKGLARRGRTECSCERPLIGSDAAAHDSLMKPQQASGSKDRGGVCKSLAPRKRHPSQ